MTRENATVFCSNPVCARPGCGNPKEPGWEHCSDCLDQWVAAQSAPEAPRNKNSDNDFGMRQLRKLCKVYGTTRGGSELADVLNWSRAEIERLRPSETHRHSTPADGCSPVETSESRYADGTTWTPTLALERMLAETRAGKKLDSVMVAAHILEGIYAELLDVRRAKIAEQCSAVKTGGDT